MLQTFTSAKRFSRLAAPLSRPPLADRSLVKRCLRRRATDGSCRSCGSFQLAVRGGRPLFPATTPVPLHKNRARHSTGLKQKTRWSRRGVQAFELPGRSS